MVNFKLISTQILKFSVKYILISKFLEDKIKFLISLREFGIHADVWKIWKNVKYFPRLILSIH